MLQGSALAQRKVPEASRRLLHVLVWFIIASALFYAGRELVRDLSAVRSSSSPSDYLLLGIALLIALGFEFVNGFHDAANAVATVIYTNALPPLAAVVWSGTWNFIGVLVSSGAVAYSVLSLLPVELILQVGSAAGFAMVFALLFSAMTWNVGTWFLGLPISSSHTLIGSIIGVGLMNQLMEGTTYTTGVDWSQAAKVGYALLLSPLIGFVAAALLLLCVKAALRKSAPHQPPREHQPPPFWIRMVLILTCTGVSFGHGSNDGQKGMGLIMLILVGLFPAAYALDRHSPAARVQALVAASDQVTGVFAAYEKSPPFFSLDEARKEVLNFLETQSFRPKTIPAISALMRGIVNAVAPHGSYADVPNEMASQIRNDMDLVDEALDVLEKSGRVPIGIDQEIVIEFYRKELDRATMFIPVWVKVVTAFALGLGTMVGWRRIVVTVGEKIGKAHLTYAQGGTAETVTMSTLIAADLYGLPVSTTHVLSSAVAGTMVANGSGLQITTVRNILLAWVLTLPVSLAIAGGLYWLMRQVV